MDTTKETQSATDVEISDIDKYTIVCDESDQHPQKDYKYFFGGAMLLEKDYQRIGDILTKLKNKFGLHEMKRTKITLQNAPKYIEVLNLFFKFVKRGEIKLRIMFAPFDQILTTIPKSENHTYTKFYFAFIKNAFNIFYCGKNFKLRLVFDDFPENRMNFDEFKGCLISSINNNRHRKSLNHVYLDYQDIESVNSEKHPILQCVDVITGCMEDALNLQQGQQLSKRAQARQQVFNAIHKEILSIIPNFNLTKTTTPMSGQKGWNRPYAHFVFRNKQNLQNPCKCKYKKPNSKKHLIKHKK